MNESVNNSDHVSSAKQSHRWLFILGAGVLAAGGYAIYLGTQTQDLRSLLADARKDNATLRAELGNTQTELQGSLDSLRDDLSRARQDASTSVARAADAATRHADVVASQLARKTSEQAEQLGAPKTKVKASKGGRS